MECAQIRERLARLLPTGFRAYVAARTASYRSYVGATDEYDVSGASQFNLLTLLGLREHHSVLDVGCGSLRAGRLLIVYLQPGQYFGIEPQRWLVESAIRGEIGRELTRIKRPVFDHHEGFQLNVFDRKFDFVLANSIFSHATQAQIRTCLSQVRDVMTPSGLFLASFAPGPTSYDGDSWRYPGTVTYTLERMRQLGNEQHLECEPIDWPYIYGTGRQSWLAFSHER